MMENNPTVVNNHYTTDKYSVSGNLKVHFSKFLRKAIKKDSHLRMFTL